MATTFDYLEAHDEFSESLDAHDTFVHHFTKNYKKKNISNFMTIGAGIVKTLLSY